MSLKKLVIEKKSVHVISQSKLLKFANTEKHISQMFFDERLNDYVRVSHYQPEKIKTKNNAVDSFLQFAYFLNLQDEICSDDLLLKLADLALATGNLSHLKEFIIESLFMSEEIAEIVLSGKSKSGKDNLLIGTFLKAKVNENDQFVVFAFAFESNFIACTKDELIEKVVNKAQELVTFSLIDKTMLYNINNSIN